MEPVPARVEPEFRPATEADVEAAAQVLREADPFGWTASGLRGALRSGNRLTMALAGGVPAGIAVVMQVLDEAELLELAVRPQFQGRGIGRALLARVMAEAAGSGALLMHLEVRVSNSRARKMYEKAGFTRCGLRRGYYRSSGGREDACLMSCPLGSSRCFPTDVPDA